MTAHELNAIRLSLAVTRRELARLIGVNESTLRRWMTGKAKPSRMAIARIEEIRRAMKGTQHD